MFRRVMDTEIEINAPAERVWRVLTDLSAYPQWNPMIRRASGEIHAGAVLRVRFEPEGAKGKNYRPRLTVVEPVKELRWKGHLSLPCLFYMEHYWIIEEMPDGKVRLLHGMFATGLLALFANRTMERTRRHFDSMNRAHRERAEGKIN